MCVTGGELQRKPTKITLPPLAPSDVIKIGFRKPFRDINSFVVYDSCIADFQIHAVLQI